MSLGTLDTKRLPAGSVLIVGAGLAGLYLALKLAPRPVYVLTSRRSSVGAASAWAQGGIAAALSPDDTAESHARDTIAAGDGLVDPEIARILATEGPARVHDLAALGVPFDRNDKGELYLSLEAAHSMPRVARVKGDTAGAEIIKTMVQCAQAADHIEGIIGWRAESLLQDNNGAIAGALAARAIFAEIEAGRQPYLDCRTAIGSHFDEEFPTVFESCMSAGIDPRTSLIPVAPAVHYHMGGLATDSFGQTSLDSLLAVGECSATGVHGANRLASNSLLEAVVFGGRAADYINNREWAERRAGTIRIQPWLSMGKDVSQTLRKAMTAKCGVRRNAQKLNELISLIDGLIDRTGRANPLVAARIIATTALAREESRGGHFREDFPAMKDKAISSYLTYDRLD